MSARSALVGCGAGVAPGGPVAAGGQRRCRGRVGGPPWSGGRGSSCWAGWRAVVGLAARAWLVGLLGARVVGLCAGLELGCPFDGQLAGLAGGADRFGFVMTPSDVPDPP